MFLSGWALNTAALEKQLFQLGKICFCVFLFGAFSKYELQEIGKYGGVIILLLLAFSQEISPAESKCRSKRASALRWLGMIFFAGFSVASATLLLKPHWEPYAPKTLLEAYFIFLLAPGLVLYFFSAAPLKKSLLLVFLGGFVWIFYLSLLSLDSPLHSNFYLKKANEIALNYLLPLVVFSCFLWHWKQRLPQAQPLQFFFQAQLAALAGLSLNAVVGLYNFFFQPAWLKSVFNVATHPDRLSSLHYIIQTGALSSQWLFVQAALLTKKRTKKRDWQRIGLGLSFAFIAVAFFLTWTKLLLLVFFPLFAVFLFLLFKHERPAARLTGRKKLALLLLFGLPLLFFLATENPIRQRTQEVLLLLNAKESPPVLGEVSASLYRRYLWYQSGIEMFLAHPWLGVGFAAHKQYYKEHYQTAYQKRFPTLEVSASTHPHSDPIGLLAETGILGFFSFYAVWLTLLLSFLANFFKQASTTTLQKERLTEQRLFLSFGMGLILFFCNGLSDYNFQVAYMNLFSVYALLFFVKQLTPGTIKTQ